MDADFFCLAVARHAYTQKRENPPHGVQTRDDHGRQSRQSVWDAG